MTHSVAGVVLAAGAGSRLAPITDWLPKPLCPVANETLLDLAAQRLQSITTEIAVNVHHHADEIREQVAGRFHVSHELPEPLGTAGALALLRPWLDERPVVVVNGDTWCPGSLAGLVDGWDGETVRVLVPGGGEFGPRSTIAGTLLPWWTIRDLAVEPTGIYEVIWRDAHQQGRLDVIAHDGPFVDCASPADLLTANLEALTGGRSVVDPTASVSGEVTHSAVGAGAVVAGTVRNCVVFAGARVNGDEHLEGVLRLPAGDQQLTVDGR